jgi:hypothetical protein
MIDPEDEIKGKMYSSPYNSPYRPRGGADV